MALQVSNGLWAVSLQAAVNTLVPQERSQLPVLGQIRADSGRRYTGWAHRSRDKHLLFAFSTLDFAKPKMPQKLEKARISVIQGFSDMHQPFIRPCWATGNEPYFFQQPVRELSVWMVFGSWQKRRAIRSHCKTTTAGETPIALSHKVLNPLG